MPPNYRYAFFDSFHASPALNEVFDEEEEEEDYIEHQELPTIQKSARAIVLSPSMLDTPVVIADTREGEVYGKQAASSESPPQISNAAPKVAVVSKVAANATTAWDKPRTGTLPVIGQGTISVKADSTIGFHIQVRTADRTLPTLYLDVTQDGCVLTYGGLPAADGGTLSSAGRREVHKDYITYPKGKEAATLREGQGPYKHWLSVDLVNGVVRYGRGYCTASLVLLQAVFKKKEDKALVYVDEKWEWLKQLQTVVVKQTGGRKLTDMVIDPFPLVRDLPPYVVKDQDITLDDLESGIVTVVANLPAACQVLYKNVAGPKIVLDAPDFPEFSQAIERSVRHPGLVGYELLKTKAEKGHGGTFTGTYLRITIGTNLGNSPGIPYVLEIWPSGHSSPIHDHGDSYAVIKVLHGQINAYYFDGLQKPGPNQLGPPATLKKDDVTWISKDSYQVHQLRNESDQLCCTIQCYQYGEEDKQHFEGFRFSADGKPISPNDEPFFPNSDMAFGEFKKAIKKEWYAYQLEKMK